MPFYPLPVAYSKAPSNPTGTTDTTGKMMGLAGSITPNQTGRVLVIVTGNLASDTNADGAKARLRLGTGTAPSNADALTGTIYGTIAVSTGTGLLANDKEPFALQALVTGLTVGTAYWIDCDLAAIAGGTASISDVYISAFEV